MIEQIKQQCPGKLVYLTKYGSHLYGLDTENSDLDYRGVFIPYLEDVVTKQDKDEFNTELNIDGKKVDVKLFSIYKFLKLCSKADTNALDVLFSYNANIEKYEDSFYMGYIYENRDKLINTDKLESPCSYAFKQATKYGLKGERYNVLAKLFNEALECYRLDMTATIKDFVVSWKDISGIPVINKHIDNKHVKIDELDNKGTIEKYLYVAGVQHQFNLLLSTFLERLHDKIEKEYTSQRTKDAVDGNDWKALSHAIRVVCEITELLETGDIKFPCNPKIKDIKFGKVAREDVDNMFKEQLDNILDMVQKDPLNWRYDENMWNHDLYMWMTTNTKV